MSNEGSILLAIAAFKSGQFTSLSETANTYNVSRATLTRRLEGGYTKHDYPIGNARLTKIEEGVLIASILELDSRGLGPNHAIVKEMADAICKAKGTQPVGIKWTHTFVKRSPTIQTRLSRVFECQRQECEDPGIISDWFRLVRNTINAHQILEQNSYNFDETGFQMGQISATTVITATGRRGRPKQIKPTNTEWVTLIQGACADGMIIPPFLVMKGKQFNRAWFQGLPLSWAFTLSENGWTTNEIGIQWIRHFEKHTRVKAAGQKRLLVLDNHGSHTTQEFRTIAQKHDIILLWMPPHSSHLLQPMDVGCFAPLKRAFSKHNEGLIRNHIHHVTKLDFIAGLHVAIPQALTVNNVQAGFRGSGLYPFDPEAVLSQLDPLPQPFESPLTSSQQSWHARTPSNTLEFSKQETLVRHSLEKHQNSSPTPIYNALAQLSKGAQIMAASTALMQSQIALLQQANRELQVRKKRKRQPLQSQGEAISVEDEQAMALVELAEAARSAAIPKTRKSPTCSRCKIQGHTMRTCTFEA